MRWLQIKSSDHQAYSDALLKLNASLIKYASRCWLHELLNHYCNHEESQDDSENDDENEAFKAVQSDKSTHSLTCNHHEQIWYIVSALSFWLHVAIA